MWAIVPAIAICGQYLESFKNFPSRQKAGSFNVSSALDKMRSVQGKQ
jgi:hypothetical protein